MTAPLQQSTEVQQMYVDPAQLPLVLDFETARALLGLGRTTLYQMCRARDIPCIRAGKQWRFGRDALLRWIESGGSVSDRPEQDEPSSPAFAHLFPGSSSSARPVGPPR